MKPETWKSIKGWENYYVVSSKGRVISLVRKIVHKNGFVQTVGGYLLKGSIAYNGYKYVDLRNSNKRKNVQVHRLVLSAFKGECPDGKEACHYDGNKLNNHIANLRYDTRQNNIKDTKRHGRIPSGENHWNWKGGKYAG